MFYSGEMNSYAAAALTYNSTTDNYVGTVVAPGTDASSEFLFRSSSSNFDEKWSRGIFVNFGSLVTWFWNGGNSSINVSNGNYYTFVVQDVSDNTNGSGIAIQTSGAIQTISSVARESSDVSPGQDLTVTATVSGALPTGQGVYLRYTGNNFSSSTIAEMSMATATTYTASIPAGTNTAGANIIYYAFSSGSGLTISPSNADRFTVNLNNNGGSNYSYTVEPSWQTTTSGDWDAPATWASGEVPVSGQSVTISHNVEFNVGAATVSNITIDGAAELTWEMASSNVLTIASGGTITNNGAINSDIGKVSFAGSGTVGGGNVSEFWDVDIAGAVNFGNNLSIISGTLTINAGGSANMNPPLYFPDSYLKYNTGGSYNRGTEWTTNDPFHVTLDNNTILVMGFTAPGTARTIDGDLTVEPGNHFRMDNNNMTAAVTVGGNVSNSGTITLSGSLGGDMNVKGNFAQNGTFTCNERALTFNGTSVQNLQGSNSFLIDYMTVDNAAGVVLDREVTVDNQLTMTDGIITLGNNNLNIGQGASISVSSPGSAKMILAAGSGTLQKFFNTTSSFLYPIGSSGEYSPVTVNATALTGTGGNISVNVNPTLHPNISNTVTNRLERYWTVTKDGDILTITYNIDLVYVDADIVGTESNLYCGKYDAGWTLLNPATTGTNTLSGTALTGFSTFGGAQQSALPIELLDFDALPDDRCVQLRWRTASEQNNSHFEIERSPDARNWQTLGSLPGAGYSTDLHTYNFMDEKPLPLNFYRLKQVDYDGNHEYSKIVSATFGESATVGILPNPASHELHLQGTGETFTALIFDQNGNLKKEASTAMIVIEDLIPGVYFIKILDEAGQSLHVERFVKQ